MMGAINSGLAGLAAGAPGWTARLGVAREGAADDLGERVIELKRARQEVRASLAVVRAADELVGALLDVMA